MIEFRGKRIDNGELVYGDVHFNADCSKCHIHKRGERVFESYKVYPESIGQSIGIKDKNDEKIWSNSFVTVYFGDLPSTLTATAKIVYTAQCQYVAEGIGEDKGKGPWSLDSKHIEVIDNPNLLEK